MLRYVLYFQNVTDIIDDVDKLFKELIVIKPLGVILDNAMEQHLRRNSSINFILPMVNLLIISTNNILVVFSNPNKPFTHDALFQGDTLKECDV